MWKMSDAPKTANKTIQSKRKNISLKKFDSPFEHVTIASTKEHFSNGIT